MAHFKLGQRVGDGDVQRHILSMHREFEDSERIDGDYVLVEIAVAAIEESEWDTDEEKARQYAALPTPFPPVVLDEDLSFIDGGHRHLAAKLRGDATMLALVPVAIAHRYHNDYAPPGRTCAFPG